MSQCSLGHALACTPVRYRPRKRPDRVSAPPIERAAIRPLPVLGNSASSSRPLTKFPHLPRPKPLTFLFLFLTLSPLLLYPNSFTGVFFCRWRVPPEKWPPTNEKGPTRYCYSQVVSSSYLGDGPQRAAYLGMNEEGCRCCMQLTCCAQPYLDVQPGTFGSAAYTTQSGCPPYLGSLAASTTSTALAHN